MKKLLVVFFVAGCTLVGFGHDSNSEKEAVKVVLENEKVKVTEFVSSPGGDACGEGKHTHKPRLVIAVTDASVKLTTEDGKSQEIDLKAGTVFWGDAETHFAVNTGNQAAKFYAIEVK
ncbi:hypothetical protein [Mariniphaga sp.]|uniref:hypothetical protein n=1 Tax=Mariniphaga sp. TaxID=1954475 RepID=UPI003561DA30